MTILKGMQEKSKAFNLNNFLKECFEFSCSKCHLFLRGLKLKALFPFKIEQNNSLGLSLFVCLLASYPDLGPGVTPQDNTEVMPTLSGSWSPAFHVL